jgi:hypothetical protein
VRPISLAVAFVLAAACGKSEPSRPAPDGSAVMVVGASTRLRLTDPIPSTSAFFDGTTVTVTIARGETLALQVLYRGAQPVDVTLGSTEIAVRRFAIEPVTVTRPSTVLWGPTRGAGVYPDRLRALGDARAPVAGPVLVELAVPSTARAGVVDGAITVGDRQLPLRVTIAPVEIPSLAARPRVWAYYDPREIAAATGEAAGGAAETACAAMMREHGIVATPELTLDNYEQRKGAVAGFPYVPVLLPGDAVEATVTGWRDKLAGTGQVAFAIPIDEPRTAEAKAAVKALSARARAAGGGPGSFLYTVTAMPDPAMGDAIDVYASPFAIKREGDRPATPERWTYNGTPPWAGAMTVDAGGVDLRTWGWIAWRWRVPLWYIWDATYWHDRHNRKRKKLDPMGGAPNDGTVDAVTFDDGEDHGNLDGAIVLPPSPAEAALGCVPTLRLAALRRGLQDRLLLDALEACGGRARAEAIAAPLVPSALGDAKKGDRTPWPADEDTWERARQRLIAELAGCML